MKRCPKCNADYYDNMLEFCLEDGTRLASLSGSPATATQPARQTASETVSMPLSPKPQHQEVETVVAKLIAPVENATLSQNKILEIAPVVVALAHNWWQWLYLEKQYYSSFMDYVFSANFLMWLLLLAAGAALSLYSIKRSERKGFAYTGLVVLAINLILFLVPRR
ncbi:MAG TPA: hypothetical protein VL325_06500 [Pyrinomonadaceae bacterium]|jgi:hypothetical protein|nr:hypothetical protein [Pyrinomonadaceae bacterium]